MNEVTIYNYKDILTPYISRNEPLPINTIIKFPVDDDIYIYSVRDNYLHAQNYSSNAVIFRVLNLDRYAFCEKIYGHKPGAGSFPEYRGVGSGMVELIMALFDECQRHNKPVKALKMSSILKSSALI